MNILALDSSTDRAVVGVLRTNTVTSRHIDGSARHSEQIIDTINAVLAEAGVSLSALDGLAVGVGPGAFTGLRLSCAVAQGLALARSLPVVALCSLHALALDVEDADEVLAVVDARMHEVYARNFSREGQGWRATGPAQCLPPSAVMLPRARQAVLLGNGLSAYPELEARARTAGLRCLPDRRVTADALARHAALRLKGGEKGVNIDALVPAYVRDKVALTTAERAACGARA